MQNAKLVHLRLYEYDVFLSVIPCRFSWTKENMGNVLIKNCTSVPLKIQLCQVGVLYHGVVHPGESFFRNTGAVHFTIKATVSDKDDTGWTDTVLPVVSAVVTSVAAIATAGVGLVPGVAGAIGLSALSASLVSGAASVTRLGIIAGGIKLTMELAQKLLSEGKKEHFYISSPGWYFGGENHLEIRGGPNIFAGSDGFSYNGRPLRIIRIK